MAKRILVPLDQSLVAEAVVALVGDMARGGGASVRLLHVAPVPEPLVNREGRVVAFVDQECERLETEGLDYLRTIELQLDGIPAECVVRFGAPVDEILREAEGFGADLIAVTTAGRSGISRAALGSVAEQVFRNAPVAVMLYHAPRLGLA